MLTQQISFLCSFPLFPLQIKTTDMTCPFSNLQTHNVTFYRRAKQLISGIYRIKFLLRPTIPSERFIKSQKLQFFHICCLHCMIATTIYNCVFRCNSNFRLDFDNNKFPIYPLSINIVNPPFKILFSKYLNFYTLCNSLKYLYLPIVYT